MFRESQKQFSSAFCSHRINVTNSVITVAHNLKDDDKTNAILLIENNDRLIKKYELKISNNLKANLQSEILNQANLDYLNNPSNYIKISFNIYSEKAKELETNLQNVQSTLDSSRFLKTFPKKSSFFASVSSLEHDCHADADVVLCTSYDWIRAQLLNIDDNIKNILPENIEEYAKAHQPKQTCSIL